MKKIKYLLSTLLILVLVLSACSTDSYKKGIVSMSWLTMTDKEGRAFVADNGKTMWALSRETNYVPKNRRVILNYSPMGGKYEGYDYAIKVNYYIYDVPTKAPVYAMGSSQEIDDLYGTKPLDVDEMFIGGGFINIGLYFREEPHVSEHYVDLISTKENFGMDRDTLYLELRHKITKGDGNVLRRGFMAFELDSINKFVKEEKNVIINIKSQTEDGKIQEDDLNYKLRPIKSNLPEEENPEEEWAN